MNDEVFRQRIEKIGGIQEDETKAYSAFIRALTTISTGLLGLLVALRPVTIPNTAAKCLFMVTISLISIGIFCSVIVQFYEVAYRRQLLKAENDMLREYLKTKNPYQRRDLPKGKLYKITEVLTYTALGLSMPTLIAYVYYGMFCE